LSLKRILLFGKVKSEDTIIHDLFKRDDFKIIRAKNADNAEKFLRFNSPDVVLCTGRILQDKNGNYFIET